MTFSFYFIYSLLLLLSCFFYLRFVLLCDCGDCSYPCYCIFVFTGRRKGFKQIRERIRERIRENKRERMKKGFVSDPPACAVCNARAKLVYICLVCDESRKYCSQFVCQSEDWDRHQKLCHIKHLQEVERLKELQASNGSHDFLEHTLIKHVSGGPTLARSKKKKRLT